MANMPDAIENAVVDWLTRGTAMPAIVAPLRVQLVSALGAGDAASTPITTGTTPIINLGASAATGGANSNAGVLRWEGLPNPTTVAGYRILDSAGTPLVTLDNIARVGGSVSVTGGIFEVAATGLTTTGA